MRTNLGKHWVLNWQQFAKLKHWPGNCISKGSQFQAEQSYLPLTKKLVDKTVGEAGTALGNPPQGSLMLHPAFDTSIFYSWSTMDKLHQAARRLIDSNRECVLSFIVILISSTFAYYNSRKKLDLWYLQKIFTPQFLSCDIALILHRRRLDKKPKNWLTDISSNKSLTL